MANYIPRKNHIFLIDVMQYLPENFKLVLAGPLKDEDNENFNNIKAKIEEYNLENRVELKNGFLDNFEEYIQQSDIFLFPSKAEGLGTPIIEAQACGVPVVANFIDGITNQWITNNEGGFTAELDPQEFSLKIEEAYKIDREVLVKNSEKILNLASSSYIDSKYYNIIKKMVSENRY